MGAHILLRLMGDSGSTMKFVFVLGPIKLEYRIIDLWTRTDNRGHQLALKSRFTCDSERSRDFSTVALISC